MSPSRSPRFKRPGADIPALPTALERTLKLKKGGTSLGKCVCCCYGVVRELDGPVFACIILFM